MSDPTTALTTQAPIEPVVLFATEPAGVASAHTQLVAWFERKAAEMRDEAREHEAALETAIKAGWGKSRLTRLTKLATQRAVFYDKVVAALREGFFLVPNFEMDVFMIRTKRALPIGGTSWQGDSHRQAAQALPQGVGEYQNPLPERAEWSEKHIDAKGQQQVAWKSRPTGWDEIEFPFELAKGHVMEATQDAAMLKLFDEIGVARDAKRRAYRRGDPMILGRLRNPRRSAPDATFFIAWLYDTSQV